MFPFSVPIALPFWMPITNPEQVNSDLPANPSTDTKSYAARPPLQEEPLSHLGPYRLLNVLGEGGMGRVYRAEDPKLKRKIALKVMRADLASDEKARQRFLREAQAQAAIEHDHIIAIFQVDEENGVPYLAMPLLKGESLAQRLGCERRLPIPVILKLGRQTAEGLAAAHARGLMHRDIKPGNLWLESTDESGAGFRRVKILDFGLARAVHDDTRLTAAGGILGTPEYMAPEQADGHEVDQRADLFSLGAVLYRCSTGNLPFAGPSTLAILSALATKTPAPVQETNPDVPPALADLIMRLLRKTPGDRPQSAQEVAGMLRSIEEEYALPSPRRTRPHFRFKAACGAVLLGLGLMAAARVIVVKVHPESKESQATGPEGSASKPVPNAPANQADPEAKNSRAFAKNTVLWTGTGPKRAFADPAHALGAVLDFREIAGASAAELRDWTAKLGGDFHVSYLSCRRGAGANLFNAVAVQESKPHVYRFYPEVDDAMEEEQDKTLFHEGFRPALICAYFRPEPKSEIVKAELWVKDGTSPFNWGVSDLNFIKEKIAETKKENCRPSHLDYLLLPDHQMSHVILPEDQGRSWEVFYSLTPEQLLSTVDFYERKNWRPDVLAPYQDGNRTRFLLVVVDNFDQVDWRFRMDMSLAEYKNDSAEEQRLGMFPLSLTSYGNETAVRYAAIWVRGRVEN